MWAVLAVAGVLVIATGWLPGTAAEQLTLDRAAPVLTFLVAITVLAELAERAGVFDAAAGLCARAARGSTLRLFLLVAALATVTTLVMSIDTTAVLLTPVVLALAQRLGLRPLPFALLVLWLANTASLLLPIANLTNLLAQQREALSTFEFARRMALPELVAVVLTVGYLGALCRRDLVGRYSVPARVFPADVWTFRACVSACVALVVVILSGASPMIAAIGCAFAAATVFAVRDRRVLRWSLIPWRIVVLTEGLFLVVAAISRHGFTDLVGRVAGSSPWPTAAVGAMTGNLVNNLPAYLAIEPSIPAGDETLLLAALIGTNAGPLVTVWGSLATLLWRERCRARGLDVSWLLLAKVGVLGAPVVVAASTAALLVTS